MERKHRSPVTDAEDWVRVDLKGTCKNFAGNGIVIYVGCGGGYMTVYICQNWI